MTEPSFQKLWRFTEAKPVSRWEKLGLGILVIAGIGSILRMAEWWFRAQHVGNLWLFLILSLVFWYGMVRLTIIWINYLGIKKPIKPDTPTGLKVAIFTTSSPGEPLSMFEKTLEACAIINYPHTTYLLDDTRDPEFRKVAEKHGSVWLELVGLPGAKAGKINAALSKTEEDFILVLDPDHIPFPNFLDEVLGFFTDPEVGFVQVSQGYYNQYRSFTALAAAEQTYTFYGPTQMGMHGYNCAVAIGANCTFRRKALETAGGFLNSIDSALNDEESASVQYSLDKKPADMWNFLLGTQYQHNKHWMVRCEVGFLGSRTQVLAGLQYRFGL